MKKGNYGINLSVFALLCIAFAILRQPIAVLLIAGYAIVAEKDEKLNKAVLMTSILMVINIFIRLFVNVIFRTLLAIIDSVKLSRVIVTLNSLTNGFIFIIFLIVYIVLAIGVIKGKDLKYLLLISW